MSTTDNLFLFAHILAAFWYIAGLTSVQLTVVRGWRSNDLNEEASRLMKRRTTRVCCLCRAASRS